MIGSVDLYGITAESSLSAIEIRLSLQQLTVCYKKWMSWRKTRRELLPPEISLLLAHSLEPATLACVRPIKLVLMIDYTWLFELS